MSTHPEFLKTYQHMSDEQLLQVAAEGGLTEEAALALRTEMGARKLGSHDLDGYRKDQEQLRTEQQQERNNSGFFRLFGHSFLSEEDRKQGIEVRTKWLTSRGIPIIPVASYRYLRKQRTIGKATVVQEKLIDRVPLYWPQVLLAYAKGLAWAVVAIVLGGLYVWLRKTYQ